MRIFGYDPRRPLWALHRAAVSKIPAPVVGVPPADRFAVAEVSGLEVPAELGVRRQWPPGIEFEVGSAETFDATMLFYDIFAEAGRVVFIRPSLLELARVLREARVSLDGVRLRPRLKPKDSDRSQIVILDVPGAAPSSITFDMTGVSMAVEPQAARHDIFRGRNVLLGKSKNNDLLWIEDWVRFHAVNQGVDAVLLYDNASTKYDAEAVLRAIRRVPEIDAAVVVKWPHKFGARGKGFDADWSQYASIEDGRRRFLRDATGVLQLDVDELVVSEAGKTVFDYLVESPVGAVTISGVWVEPVRSASAGDIRHRDYRYKQRAPTDNTLWKWAVIPRLIPDTVRLTVHGFTGGFRPTAPRDIRFRHFRAISTGWKYDRPREVLYDPLNHELDKLLSNAMAQAGWT